tara:strand:+ start:893 stop:2065 length:1173 start_codon:yes stop_codon:yes gene_type:complete
MNKELTMENTILFEEWESKEFEKCLEKVTYSKKIKRKEFLSEGLHPIISQEKEKINGYWDNSDDLFKVNKPVVIFGDHTKTFKYIDFDFVLGADGVKILLANENINSRYLFYFLQNIELGDLGYARHYRLLKEIQISYPKSITQQKQIVAILDKAFAAIDIAKANAIQNLQNAKELFESYLQNVFEKIKANGQLYSLANYLDLITYGFTNPMPTTDEGPYKVTAKDVKYGIVNYKTARRTSQDAFDNLIRDKCKPKKGDVLLTKDGTLGRLAVVEKANMCINQSVALLRPTKELDSYYLKELLSSKFYQELMIEQAGGATIKHIYITRIDKMLVPVPSITEQLAIIKKLDALSSETKKLEAIYTKKIADLDEMKKSVLQKAFSGQLNTIN